MTDHASKDTGGLMKAFDELPLGSLLPAEGDWQAFPEALANPGETAIFREGGDFWFLHANHDLVIAALDTARGHWDLRDDTGRSILTLVLREGAVPYPIAFVLDRKHDRSREIIEYLCARKAMTLHFLAIVFGGFAKEQCATFPLPEEILAALAS